MKPIETLKEDFSQTLGFIDKCDDHIFKIKNWALITSSAVIAYSISKEQHLIVLVNLILLLAFLYLELIYKSFQDTAIKHSSDISNRIDKYLAEPTTIDLLDGYNHSFGRKLKNPSVKRVFSVLVVSKYWHIFNFYFLLSMFSVGAYFFGKYIT